MAHDGLRHRGGQVARFEVYDGTVMKALRDLPQWEILGGRCSSCAWVGWLDKRAVMTKIGNHFLVNVRPRLRCSRCRNGRTNQLLLGMMDRNA